MHAHGEIHGDIVPDHIRIRYDGTPVLLRFAGGHASAAGGAESASHPGYAPPEQYASDRAATGPWTDIYMLAATIYRTITGQPPPDATSRLNNDRYVPSARAAAPGYRHALLAAVDWALRTSPRERPQSVQAWRQMLFQEDPVANASTGGVAPPTSVPISALPTAGSAHTTAIPLTWHQPLGFVGLSILNFLMRIPTVGLYAFWGRTEVRKRIWSGIRLDGEPLQYTGTGKELMIGFFIIFGAILVPYLLLTLGVVAALGQGALPIYQLISYAGFLLLYGIGTYRAQRYRLSRTRWRGIRGSLTGSSWSYGWTAWWTLPLLVLTLGWLSPWRSTRLQSMLVGDMKFGDQPFRFTATSSGLYGRYAATWIGTIIVVIGAFAAIGLMVRGVMGDISPANATEAMKAKIGFATMGILGLAYILYTVANAWYRAGMLNHFARHTHIDNATFYGTATTGGVLWVTVSNAILSLGTLGLLTPVAQARWTRYLVEHMRLNGTVSLAAINQGVDQGIRHGEGLAQAFDLDAF